MPVETKPWDASKHLETPQDIAEYLDEILEDGDVSALPTALGTIARAKGMSQIARDAGVARDTLYKALVEGGDPRLSTLSGVLLALGARLSAEVQPAQLETDEAAWRSDRDGWV